MPVGGGSKGRGRGVEEDGELENNILSLVHLSSPKNRGVEKGAAC